MLIEVRYDKHGVIVVISKSSFLPEELERRILRDYCRAGRPSMHIYVYARLGAQFEDIR